MPLIVKKSKAFSPLAYCLSMRFDQRIRAERPNRQNEKENEDWPARFLGLSKSQLVMVELSNTDFLFHITEPLGGGRLRFFARIMKLYCSYLASCYPLVAQTPHQKCGQTEVEFSIQRGQKQI